MATTSAVPSQFATWQHEIAGLDAAGILAWATATFPGRVAFASSLGLEDQAITHLIATQGLAIPIFTLDTGRLFPESHTLIATTSARYGVPIRIYAPEAAAVEALVNEHGTECYLRSVELRRACCRVRKVLPLARALAGLDAWVCGLRRSQGPTRSTVNEIEWDQGNGLVKINPLAAWDDQRLQTFCTDQQVPVHPLHARGFPSIGCACCTRAVAPGEDPRAGRWWWEQPENRECGLHWQDGKLVRTKQEKDVL